MLRAGDRDNMQAKSHPSFWKFPYAKALHPSSKLAMAVETSFLTHCLSLSSTSETDWVELGQALHFKVPNLIISVGCLCHVRKQQNTAFVFLCHNTGCARDQRRAKQIVLQLPTWTDVLPIQVALFSLSLLLPLPFSCPLHFPLLPTPPPFPFSLPLSEAGFHVAQASLKPALQPRMIWNS